MQFAGMEFDLLAHGQQDNCLVHGDHAGGKFMSTIFKIILGTAIAAVSIASPAFAQYTSQKGHLATVHHSGHVLFDRQFAQADLSKPAAAGLLARAAVWLVIALVALNVVSTLLECGFAACPDNPVSYQLLKSTR
jgi:hypothetical protein